MIEAIGIWLLLCAAYAGLVWGLARLLPPATYPALRGLHWGTTALALLAGAAPAVSGGDWTFRSIGLLCGVLLAGGVLAGVRGRLRLPRVPALAIAQAVAVGLLAPLLLGGTVAGSATADVGYADASYRVLVTEHTSWLMDNDETYAEAKLYGTRLGLFEEYLGHISYAPYGTAPTAEVLAWWRGVALLTIAADSNRGVARRQNGTYVAVGVNPPYRAGRDAVPAPPPPTPPPSAALEDDKPYSYVEVMPRLSDSLPSRQALCRAVEQRLVLPPKVSLGVVTLSMVVDKQGRSHTFRIVQGRGAVADSAVLAAARQLPRLLPGTQGGRPVNVSYYLPIQVFGPGYQPPSVYRQPPEPRRVEGTELVDLSGLE